jgi:hypothetical protein
VVASWVVFQLKHGGRQCWGVRKIGGNPRTLGLRNRRNNWIQSAIHESQGDKESPKDCSRLKSCEPLYTCPRAPFYRET